MDEMRSASGQSERAGRKAAKTGTDGRTNTAFRLKPEVYEALAKAATEREVSMNWIANRAIVDFLGRLIPVEEIKWTKD